MKLPTPRCPAANFITEVPGGGCGVVCRIMHAEGVRADAIIEGRVVGALVTDRDDSTTLRGFCCGKAFPKAYEGQEPRAHYSFCPVWEAMEEAEREATEAEPRVAPLLPKPKILGDDPEVAAGLLGMDPEQMRYEEERYAERNPKSLTAQKLRDEEQLGSETTTGIPAMEEVANDPEWEEPS